ncbi:MAG: type II toxin-antitoxin system HicA family toxin [Spirochaetaceae bacterium]|nr:type II toxin-antitoxin system HicA family toxin [Spirochaetaceae bacterium]
MNGERKVIKELKDNGYIFLRHGKGSHDVYSDGKNVIPVPKTVSKRLANVIMEEAGVKKRF